MPALNSIPPQTDELCRALVTVGTASQWYNNRDGDSNVQGSATGDLLIAADPTPGEIVTDVELDIGTFFWFTSDNRLLVRRVDPQPPVELGFNSWLTQGRVTGNDRVRTNTAFQTGDPALLYSLFFQFTDGGSVIELEIDSSIHNTSGAGHHFVNFAIPSAHQAAFNGVTAGSDFNFVIALRSSLNFTANGQTSTLTLTASEATGQAEEPSDGVQADGQPSRLRLWATPAQGRSESGGVTAYFADGRPSHLYLSSTDTSRFGFDDAGFGFDQRPFAPTLPHGRPSTLALTAAPAQGRSESGGVTAHFASGHTSSLTLTATQATGRTVAPVDTDGETSTLTLTVSEATGSTVAPHFSANGRASTLTLTASEATGTARAPGFAADGQTSTLTLAASQATGRTTVPTFTADGRPSTLTLGASEATGRTVAPVSTAGATSTLTLTASQATGRTASPGTADGQTSHLTLTASQAQAYTELNGVRGFFADGQPSRLSLAVSQATGQTTAAQVTLNSIPPQADELCRALITTGTAEWWYNNRIGDATIHGSFAGDLTIVADPTPGETVTDVELLLGTLRWRGAGGSTSDQFLVRRHDPAPPAARGFNGWLTQGRITGDDRLRLNQVTFAPRDPGDRYSVFFVFTATGDVIELELREVLGSSIGTGHHFMNLRIPAGHHAAFDAVGAGQDINFVLAQRTSLFETDGETSTLTLGASEATGRSDVPQFNTDGETTELTLTASQATGSTVAPHFEANGRASTLTLTASQATGNHQAPGFTADGQATTLTLTASQATGRTDAPGFTADGRTSTLTLTASQATGRTAVAGSTANGATSTLTLTATQATGRTVAPVNTNGETTELTLTVSQATGTTQAPRVPDAPTAVRLLEGGQTTVLIGWTAPADDGGLPITDYEYQLDSGAWTSIGNLTLRFRLTGLTAGSSYTVRVRAVNAVGAGAASAAFRFSAHVARRPGETRSLFARATGRTSVELTWLEASTDVEGDDPVEYYEVAVVYEDGTQSEWERTTDDTTRWTVRGLAAGHRYGFRVRAINSIGAGPATATVYTIPASPAVLRRPTGRRIPLLDADRQSLVVQLGGVECRLEVWWQPSALSWWASLEAPIDTQAVQGRRLALNGGILDRTVGILDGNIVLRELGDTGAEPGRDSWRRPTHSLVWEPA